MDADCMRGKSRTEVYLEREIRALRREKAELEERVFHLDATVDALTQKVDQVLSRECACAPNRRER